MYESCIHTHTHTIHKHNVHYAYTYTTANTHIHRSYIYTYHQDPVSGDRHELVAAPVQVVLVNHVT